MMIRNSQFRVLLFFLGLLSLTACDPSAVLDENVKLPENQWALNNVVRLEADINDTVIPHNIYINVRNAGGYSFSNLFLFMNTYTPDGKFARDTIEVTLADERGQWLGDGMGDIWDNRILFKKNFVFPQSGKYRFELEQAMRVNPLPGIMDVGIRIEKAK
jgi:gliding motility-associated lipoprotein GldH